MRISKLQTNPADWLYNRFGVSDPTLLYTEVLRAELWARRVCSKLSLKRYLDFSFADFQEFEHPFEVCLEQGIQHKEISQGPRGILAATPLRLIPKSEGHYFFLGGPESHQLTSRFDVEMQQQSPLRLGHIASSTDLNKLLDWGALIISPAQWAGLDRYAAVGEFISGLEQELAGQTGQTWSEPQRWQAYTPAEGKSQRERWQYQDFGQLWRSWQPYGYWLYAWTAGESPNTAQGIRLSKEQALRAGFALDLEANTQQTLRVSMNTGAVFLEMSLFLPASEYRFFSLFATRISAGKVYQYRVSLEDWPEIQRVLEQNLGIRCEE